MVCKIITQKYIKTPYEIQQKEAIVVGSNTSVSNWRGSGEVHKNLKCLSLKEAVPNNSALNMPQSSQTFGFNNT